MNDATIGRNYAETLLVLARRSGDTGGGEGGAQEEWGTLIKELGAAMREDKRLRTFLESPKISAGQKIEVLAKALGNRVPKPFLRFLETLVGKRRQMLIPSIATEYRALIDASEDKVHANVTVAREPAAAEREALTSQLSRLYGKRVVPHITLNPAILGGVIVRVGDTVMDGSVRRRLATLKNRMIASAR